MRIAFFGGSFDPPHNGHLAVARAAQAAFQLDEVLFAPVGLQPHKPAGSAASFADRVEMTRLAIASDPAFALSLIDAPNSHQQPNFTVDTLQTLRHSLPPATELFFLLGADAFRGLPHWRGAAEIPFLANLIVAARPEPQIEDNPGLLVHLPEGLSCRPASRLAAQPQALIEYRLTNPFGQETPLYLLPNLNYEVSATQLREEVHSPQQSPTRRLIAPAVLEYIRAHCLYC
jgi:nicotinate-nucleotide adenylyltransferase